MKNFIEIVMNRFCKYNNVIISTHTFLFDQNIKAIQLAILLILKKVNICFLFIIFGGHRDKASLETTNSFFINTITQEMFISECHILYNLTERKLNI